MDPYILRLRPVVLAVVALLLLAGCMERWSGTETSDVPVTPAITPETSITPETRPTDDAQTATTTMPDPSEIEGEFETVACGEVPGELICEVYELIRRHYVDDIDAGELADEAVAALRNSDVPVGNGIDICPLPSSEFVAVCNFIDVSGLEAEAATEVAAAGMVFGVLDANSAYFDASSLALIEEEQSGQIEGIGALVATESPDSDEPNSCQIIAPDCRLKIVSTIEGGPARDAGIEAGDEFVMVDGQTIEGWTVDEVTAAVRGEAGTGVELTFTRGGQEFTLTIVRAAIQVPVVSSDSVGNVAYLRLNVFSENADEQLHRELERLLSSGPDALVLDLRNNPGGLLDTAIAVTSEFLGEGTVVSTQSPARTTPYEVTEGGIATDPSLPLFVIVNRGSASASEVVAGALSDTGRATIVGENTFGKNTVQQRFPLSNGGALKLTIARWFTPDGRDFGGSGIDPDVRAELPETLSVPELVELVVPTT